MQPPQNGFDHLQSVQSLYLHAVVVNETFKARRVCSSWSCAASTGQWHCEGLLTRQSPVKLLSPTTCHSRCARASPLPVTLGDPKAAKLSGVPRFPDHRYHTVSSIRASPDPSVCQPSRAARCAFRSEDCNRRARPLIRSSRFLDISLPRLLIACWQPKCRARPRRAASCAASFTTANCGLPVPFPSPLSSGADEGKALRWAVCDCQSNTQRAEEGAGESNRSGQGSGSWKCCPGLIGGTSWILDPSLVTRSDIYRGSRLIRARISRHPSLLPPTSLAMADDREKYAGSSDSDLQKPHHTEFYDPSKETKWTRIGLSWESFKRAPGTTGCAPCSSLRSRTPL